MLLLLATKIYRAAHDRDQDCFAPANLVLNYDSSAAEIGFYGCLVRSTQEDHRSHHSPADCPWYLCSPSSPDSCPYEHKTRPESLLEFC